jgi:hypothetical protein
MPSVRGLKAARSVLSGHTRGLATIAPPPLIPTRSARNSLQMSSYRLRMEPQSQSGTKEIRLAVVHCYLLGFRGPVDAEQVKRLIAAMPRLLRLRARHVCPARLAQSSRPSQKHSRTASMCHAAEDERVVICGAGLAGEHLLPSVWHCAGCSRHLRRPSTCHEYLIFS